MRHPSVSRSLGLVACGYEVVAQLVINQATLSQSVQEAGVPQNSPVVTGLDEFLQITRDVQDCAMMIRAQPVEPLGGYAGRGSVEILKVAKLDYRAERLAGAGVSAGRRAGRGGRRLTALRNLRRSDAVHKQSAGKTQCSLEVTMVGDRQKPRVRLRNKPDGTKADEDDQPPSEDRDVPTPPRRFTFEDWAFI